MIKLTDEFLDSELEWKPQNTGSGAKGVWAMVLCYVSARSIQNRLDAVFGVLGWRDTYRFEKNGVICELSVYDNEKKEWIAKENGSPETDIESFKGGISSAFKRVASSGFGIGRYLYDLGTTFAEVSNVKVQGWNQAKTKEGVKFWWKTPSINSVRTNTTKHTQPNTQTPPTYTPNTPSSTQNSPSPTKRYAPKPASDKQKNLLTNKDVAFEDDLDVKTAIGVIDLVVKGIKPPHDMSKTEDFKKWIVDQNYRPAPDPDAHLYEGEVLTKEDIKNNLDPFELYAGKVSQNEVQKNINEAVDPFELKSAPKDSFEVTLLDEVKIHVQKKSVEYLKGNTDELQAMISLLSDSDKETAQQFVATRLATDKA
tara:strand:- start:2894 stop:3997 length:1104 start_codon:yes stop_codon:yes gene_type:complete